MNILSAVISLCSSFWMWIYLFGLSITHSAKYQPLFQLFPVILFSISIYCFYLELKSRRKL